MAIILLIKTEEGQVTELPIFGKVTLGRSGNSDFKIADIKMSGTHCSFEVNEKGQILFSDLGSSNGSYLNNSQVLQTLFRVNDIIKIGNTLIKLDEKRLLANERLAIGLSQVKKKSDKTLPEMSRINTSDLTHTPESEQIEPPKKKTIVLNKEHKEKKKISANWVANENLIDQEASNGMTRVLKLALNKIIKKKK